MADETNNETDKSRTQRLRAQQAEDGKRAMAEYLAGAEATRAKTERLRTLRLAQGAAAKAAPPLVPSAPKTAKRVRKPKAPAA